VKIALLRKETTQDAGAGKEEKASGLDKLLKKIINNQGERKRRVTSAETGTSPPSSEKKQGHLKTGQRTKSVIPQGLRKFQGGKLVKLVGI